MEQQHKEFMEQWAYIGSEQHLKDITEEVLKDSHADITPPWED